VAERLTRSVGRRLAATLFAALALCTASPAVAAPHVIESGRSTITVRVFKAGLFRAFGDNHEVVAPITAGSVDDGARAAVQVVVDARGMRVVDPGLSPDDRDEVQRRMLGPAVLDTDRFPDIRFVSTGIIERQPGLWTVQGDLTLHGQTHVVTATVMREEGHYRGTASFKQTSFGITPVSVAGGTVKVKDEVKIDFDIVTR
jgi:polyisoprenoid-binding protein YceI